LEQKKNLKVPVRAKGLEIPDQWYQIGRQLKPRETIGTLKAERKARQKATPEELEENARQIMREHPNVTREMIEEWDKIGRPMTHDDAKEMQARFREVKTRKFSASPECQVILKSDLPATQKISDLVNIFFRDNPDFESVEKELQHPGYFMIHRSVLPWLYAQCDEGFDYIKLWELFLAAAKVWFPDKAATKLGHRFCVRFEIEDCTWWEGWEEIQPLRLDYLNWHYGNIASNEQDPLSTMGSSKKLDQERATLTENDAATAFAKAWNKLDCSKFIQFLADNAVYESQWVFTPLEGKEAIAHYLIGKMETVKTSGKKVRAELSTARCGHEFGKPCVVLKQGDNRDTDAVMLFELDGDRIKRCDLCAPELFDPEPTEVYPA